MEQLDGLPVVVGSSMSGLLVSTSLSRAGVDHVLVGGDEPADVPRLGESLNECAGPELWRLFGAKFQRYFYTKNHISVLNGDFATMLHIGNPNRGLGELTELFQPGGRTPLKVCIKGLLHVDRIGLDRAVYHEARAKKHCHFVGRRIQEVCYDGQTDSIVEIRFADGEEISRPQYVFDATGPRGLVAEAASVGKRAISNQQRVVWTHYRQSKPRDLPRLWWLYGTNLLRLHTDVDQIDGISWLIPLGDTVSVGISVDACESDSDETDKATIMRLLAEAYQRRGIDYCRHFDHQREIQELKHRYYVRDRAFGANWLLVGGTFVQVWFPSSAGLWTSTAAAGMAPELIRDPLRFGRHYEETMRPLLAFHDMLEELVHGPAFDSEMDAYWFWSRWLARIPRRVSDYLRITNDDFDRWRLSYWFLEWMSRQFVKHPRGTLNYWGLFLVRNHRMSELPRQVDAFPKYFAPVVFRAKNYLVGQYRLLRSLLPWRWSKRRWDD